MTYGKKISRLQIKTDFLDDLDQKVSFVPLFFGFPGLTDPPSIHKKKLTFWLKKN